MNDLPLVGAEWNQDNGDTENGISVKISIFTLRPNRSDPDLQAQCRSCVDHFHFKVCNICIYLYFIFE